MHEPFNAPRIDAATEPGRVILRAAGRWTAAGANAMTDLLAPWEARAGAGTTIALDASQLEAFDTYGAWIIERWRRQCTARGATVAIVGLPQRFESLLSEVAETNRAAAAPAPAAGHVAAGLAAIGQSLANAAEALAQLVNILENNPKAPVGNVVARNIFVGEGWKHVDEQAEPLVTYVDNLADTDPLFVDAAEGNYRLKPESPAIALGFKEIPFEKIGLYLDELRTEK